MQKIKGYIYLMMILAVSSCGDETGTKSSADKISGLQIVSGNLQQGTVGQPLPNPFVVRAVDTNGSPMSGQRVEFSIAPGSEGDAIFSPVLVESNSDGLAQTNIQLGKHAGKVALQAAWERKNELQIALASLTSLPDEPAQIVVVSGNDQCQETFQNFEKLVVRAADQYGNGLSFRKIQVDVDRANILIGTDSVHSKEFETDINGLVEVQLEAGDLVSGEIFISIPYPVNFQLVGTSITKTLVFRNSWPATIFFSPTVIQASPIATTYNIVATSYGICAVHRPNKLIQFYINDVYKLSGVTDSFGSVELQFKNSDFPNISHGVNNLIRAYDYEISGTGVILVKGF